VWRRVLLLDELRSLLWLRPAVAALLAPLPAVGVLAFDAHGIVRYVPAVDDGPLGELLGLMAGSLLTVTTVSLSVLVVVLTTAGGQASPRALPAVLGDGPTQNALAALLGGFVYAVAAGVVLQWADPGDGRVTLLYGLSVLVFALAVGSFLHWVHHVANSLKVSTLTARVHAAGIVGIAHHHEEPTLGCTATEASPPAPKLAVGAPLAGYVRAVQADRLHALAEAEGLSLTLQVRPGGFVHQGEPTVGVAGTDELQPQVRDAIVAAIEIGRERTYVQDPLFAPTVLGEIACRALSPGINDPRTALAALGYLRDLLVRAAATPAPAGARYPRVAVPAVPLDLFLDHALAPVARDGAGQIEVALAVLEVLHALAATAPAADRPAIGQAAARAAELAERGLAASQDRDRVRQAFQRLRTL